MTSPSAPARRHPAGSLAYVIQALTLILSFGLTVALASNKAPWWHEGVLADPGSNLANRGILGASYLHPAGHPYIRLLPRIDTPSYCYIQLYLLAFGGWSELFGFSFVVPRFFLILCGLVALLAWVAITRRVARDTWLVTCVLLIVATDYSFLLASAAARMDALTEALGYGGYVA